jgi:hypothetical protein
MWVQAKMRAKRDGVLFAIRPSDIVIPTTCPVFGTRLTRTVKQSGPNSPSLDRLVPARGYIPENIRVISWRANDLKRDASRAELARLVDWMGSENLE